MNNVSDCINGNCNAVDCGGKICNPIVLHKWVDGIACASDSNKNEDNSIDYENDEYSDL